ncbi:MAG: DUF4331 family protein [Mycobacteriales bacterium]
MARPSTASRGRRTLAGVAAAATALGGLGLLAPTGSSASSHREAPFIAGEPRVDNTDVYAFTSPDDESSVTLIGNWIPFQEPNGGPNFYPWADGVNYDINIDNDGDAVADLTYRWVFSSGYRNPDTFLYNTGPVTTLDDPDLNFQQTYDLTVIREGLPTVSLLDNAPVAPSNVGPASMPNYQALRDGAIAPITTLSGAGSSFAGQADDSFFLDLRIFDLLYGGDLSEVGNDTLNGYNVNTIALQVPKAAVAQNNLTDRNPVIGVWSDTEMPSTRVLSDSGTVDMSGPSVQVSRLGNPLVNEVVIPISDKDKFNASTPVNDGQFLDFVTDPAVPKLIEAIYDMPAPATPRNDLVSVFLTGIDGVNSLAVNQDVAQIAPGEMLRLNMSTPVTESPNRLGVIGGDSQGFPNGRRLTDDVVDIELQVLEGELTGNPNNLGDAVNSNDRPFGDVFPYVALPQNSSVNQSQFAGFDRLAGPDRWATAADIAVKTFGTADTVLLANGRENHLPDSLAGNYLAGFEKAPILLTDDGGVLPPVTQAALDTLGTTRVIILGGTDAVSDAQATQLDAKYDVQRVAGADRYATAAAIATTPPDDYVGNGTAIVARGDNGQWADALVSGPISYGAKFPILLTRSDGLPPESDAALDALNINRAILAGGTDAISEAVAGQIGDSRGAGSMAVTRVAGPNRQDTAVAMATFATGELGFARLHVDLARGDIGVDALTGGPHAGAVGGVILLTMSPTELGAVTRDFLAAESVTVEAGDVFGGTAAVSAAVVADATDAANSNDPTLG